MLLSATKLISLTISAAAISAAVASQSASSSTSPPSCAGPTVILCSGGCWNPSGKINGNGYRDCQAVGLGFYSPIGDDRRYPCPAGSYAANDHMSVCTPCPVGTFSSTVGAAQCQDCPSASYASTAGSLACEACDPVYYQGVGCAYAMTQETNGQMQLVCVPPLSGSENSTNATASPTTGTSQEAATPTVLPTASPSTRPRGTPALPTTISPPIRQGPVDGTAPNNNNNNNNGSHRSAVFPLAAVALAVGLIGLMGVFWYGRRRSLRKGVANATSSSQRDRNVAVSGSESSFKSYGLEEYHPHDNGEPDEEMMPDEPTCSVNQDDDDEDDLGSVEEGLYLNDQELRAMERATGLDFGLDHDNMSSALDDPSVAVGTVWSMPAASVRVRGDGESTVG